MGETANRGPGRETAGVFAQRVVEIINDGALALLMSIGHRTGLFDVMAERAPSTVEQIAQAAGLSEPFLREWLEAMAKAGIVSHDSDGSTYQLPSEQAASLSRAGSPGNLAALAEYVPLLGAVEDRIVRCFEKGGRIPYDARASFRELISKAAKESDRAVVATLVDSIFPLAPGLVEALRRGVDVLDIGCGGGRGVNLMAVAFPRSRFWGHDPAERRIDRAMWRAAELGLTNIHFECKDVADLEDADRFDVITDFGAVREQPRSREALQNIARALRPGGIFLMQEISVSKEVDESFDLPADSPLYTLTSLQRMAEGREEGNGRSGTSMSEQELRNLLLAAGFDAATTRRFPHHVYNCYFIATKRSG
jgi:2-polyprenyl-3-methyl-5-hydroxy-6-metoxy-1,4-benzoquinol methylase